VRASDGEAGVRGASGFDSSSGNGGGVSSPSVTSQTRSGCGEMVRRRAARARAHRKGEKGSKKVGGPRFTGARQREDTRKASVDSNRVHNQGNQRFPNRFKFFVFRF
jgi:hypothetical protein